MKPLAALALVLSLSATHAQMVSTAPFTSTLFTSTPDTGSARVLTTSTKVQTTSATFLFQGDDLPLNELTVSHETSLKGSSDMAWLQRSDAGFQATLTLSTPGFSAQIEGSAAQSDPSGALQSVINTALAQGYTTIPNGSTLKFMHTLNISTLPMATPSSTSKGSSKPTVQLIDTYTLQDNIKGLGSSAGSVGVIYLQGVAKAVLPNKP